jgi:hypothetical protein
MVKFAQAYHYITDCPLREKSEDPLVMSPLGEWYTEHALPILVDMFKYKAKGSYVYAVKRFADYMSELSKKTHVFDKTLKIGAFQRAAVNMSLLVEMRQKVPYEVIGDFTAAHMEARVDLMRKKENQTIELMWFICETVLPNADEQNVLSLWTNWHARAYELKYNLRPYQLTVYYPLIGDSIEFVYNPYNGLDVVAELIHRGALYANPKRERCLSCRHCPEYWRFTE